MARGREAEDCGRARGRGGTVIGRKRLGSGRECEDKGTNGRYGDERERVFIGAWNIRTMNTREKLEELKEVMK